MSLEGKVCNRFYSKLESAERTISQHTEQIIADYQILLF